MTTFSEVIIGGGPAGLTAAHELLRYGHRPLVLEQGNRVGGIARTESYKGYRFDIGGHRFYTKVPEIQQLWEEMLGPDFLRVSRLSRIYYGGRFFNYPLSIMNVLGNLGIVESLLILFSYVQAQVRPHRQEESFEEWVVNRFGERLYRTFFKTYTEKVWGIPCTEIRADWAAQRIKGLSLPSAVFNALFGTQQAKSLIDEFHYPRLGPGQMWERFQGRIEASGGKVLLNTPVLTINRSKKEITSVNVAVNDESHEISAQHFISSMPISRLVMGLSPPAPARVRQAACDLKYRDFLIVSLIVNQSDVFPDNWIYIHSPDVQVGRIQNFKNWSPDLVPNPSKTCLGMEYFCSEGDGLWELPDGELIELARREIEQLGLASAVSVEDGCVLRQRKAYPVYDTTYRANLDILREYLDGFTNLQTIGRNGMHRYNNQDHSMLCGLYAARNVLGGKHNLWSVNTERSYYEEHQVSRGALDAAEGLQPNPPLITSFEGTSAKPQALQATFETSRP